MQVPRSTPPSRTGNSNPSSHSRVSVGSKSVGNACQNAVLIDSVREERK